MENHHDKGNVHVRCFKQGLFKFVTENELSGLLEYIFALIDPRGRPTVTAGSDHCFCTCRPFVRPPVRPHFSKQNKFQAKTMFTTGKAVGLAEWINGVSLCSK